MSGRGLLTTGVRGERSQSNVIAVVLLAAIVIVAATTVVVAGSMALDQRRSQSSFQAAEEQMQSIDAQIDQVATSGGAAEIDLSGFESGEANVDGDAGSINVTLNTGSEIYTTETELGAIEYEQDQRRVAYQSGGVFRVDGNDSTVLSPPSVEYRGGGTRRATLSIPVITVDEAPADSDLQVQQTGVNSLVRELATGHPNAPSMTPLPPGADLTITVQSQYYEAWGEVFEERVETGISYDHSENEVILEFQTPQRSASIRWAMLVRSSVDQLTNNMMVDSYTSNDGDGYPESPPVDEVRSEGDVWVAGDLRADNGPDINGDLRVNGSLESNMPGEIAVNGTVSFRGEILISDSSSPPDNVRFNETFSTKGNLSMGYGSSAYPVEFGDDVIVGGELTSDFKTSLPVDGSLHLHNSNTAVIGIHYGTHTVINGSIIADGPVRLDQGAELVRAQGSSDAIRAGGNVTIRNDVILNGNVSSDSSVRIRSPSGNSIDNVTIRGDVVSNGTVIVGPDVTITGEIRAADGWEVIGPSTSCPADEGCRVTGEFNVPVDPREPLPTEVPVLPSASPMIDRHEETLWVNHSNDNSASSDVDNAVPNSDHPYFNNFECEPDPCTLEHGEYAVETLRLFDNQELVLDTSDGPIDIYINDTFRVNGGAKIRVTGSHRVNVYMGEEYATFSHRGNISVEQDQADHFWVFMRPDSGQNARFSVSSAKFTGVLYGAAGSQTQVGTTIDWTNGVEIKGALIGDVGTGNEDMKLHYDRALNDAQLLPEGPDSSGGSNTLRYLNLREQQISAE